MKALWLYAIRLFSIIAGSKNTGHSKGLPHIIVISKQYAIDIEEDLGPIYVSYGKKEGKNNHNVHQSSKEVMHSW